MSLICRKACSKTFADRSGRYRHEKKCGVVAEPEPPAVFDIQEPIGKYPFDPETARMGAIDNLFGQNTLKGSSQ